MPNNFERKKDMTKLPTLGTKIGNTENVRFLIEKEAKVNTVVEDGKIPHRGRAIDGHVEYEKMMLEKVCSTYLVCPFKPRHFFLGALDHILYRE